MNNSHPYNPHQLANALSTSSIHIYSQLTYAANAVHQLANHNELLTHNLRKVLLTSELAHLNFGHLQTRLESTEAELKKVACQKATIAEELTRAHADILSLDSLLTRVEEERDVLRDSFEKLKAKEMENSSLKHEVERLRSLLLREREERVEERSDKEKEIDEVRLMAENWARMIAATKTKPYQPLSPLPFENVPDLQPDFAVAADNFEDSITGSVKKNVGSALNELAFPAPSPSSSASEQPAAEQTKPETHTAIRHRWGTAIKRIQLQLSVLKAFTSVAAFGSCDESQAGAQSASEAPAQSSPTAPSVEFPTEIETSTSISTSQETSKTTVFVANLPFKVTNEDMFSIFQEYKVTSAHVVNDPDRNGRNKGFGFVELENEEQQQKVLNELKNVVVDGRELVIKVALASQIPHAMAEGGEAPGAATVEGSSDSEEVLRSNVENANDDLANDPNVPEQARAAAPFLADALPAAPEATANADDHLPEHRVNQFSNPTRDIANNAIGKPTAARKTKLRKLTPRIKEELQQLEKELDLTARDGRKFLDIEKAHKRQAYIARNYAPDV
ncbi:hypothetical protein HK097_004496 [Rhizophlyctis rosea]|uniref:RRM domain-containing protein n=1 Tax=Rhizophlyctis rosea TaxID=64517 RepID=A0AAD5X022_9FUNG|nr:hypothetical protein HK097_004496 [Rhizophlyctis rosea]